MIPADPGVRRAIQSGQPPTSGRLGRAYRAVAAQLHPTGGRAPQPPASHGAGVGRVGCPGTRRLSGLGASDMTAIDPYGQSSADDGLVARVRGAAAAELARRLGPAAVHPVAG